MDRIRGYLADLVTQIDERTIFCHPLNKISEFSPMLCYIASSNPSTEGRRDNSSQHFRNAVFSLVFRTNLVKKGHRIHDIGRYVREYGMHGPKRHFKTRTSRLLNIIRSHKRTKQYDSDPNNIASILIPQISSIPNSFLEPPIVRSDRNSIASIMRLYDHFDKDLSV